MPVTRYLDPRGAIMLPMALLAACSGAGGGGMISTPAPTPAPTTIPTTGMPSRQPVAAQFDTAEFRRSNGPAEHNAATAWSGGSTGQGVTIAIVDTGVDEDSPEFAGRISPLSKDVLNAGRPVTGSDDHGTHVAMVAAAARNDSGIVGIAFAATILALRTDSVGSCAADDPRDSDADCQFADRDIAAAVNYAAANRAKVINISLGGDGATVELRNAARAAADAGSLLVIAAGNEGAANPGSFATLLDQAADGGAIIVGSVNSDGSISDYSNRAGTQASHFLTALGDRICCTYEDGQLYVDEDGFVYLFSGTSFATAQVSGAAALLAQAFPNLTGRQIAEILLSSAFDAGAPGTDSVYGRGILDIARAFQPLGTTSLAGLGTPVALGDVTGAGSIAMGDAFAAASLPTLVTDAYGRAFETDLAGTLTGAEVTGRLRGAVEAGTRHVSMASDATAMAFSIDATDSARLHRVDETRPDGRGAEGARVLAARVVTRPASDLRLGFAYGEGAQGLVAALRDEDRPVFLLAPDAAGDDGPSRSAGASAALRRQIGPWGLTFSAEQGQTWSGAAMRRQAEMTGRRLSEDVATYGVALDRRLRGVDAALGLAWMDEERTLLGGRFHDAFGLTGADTLFLDARAGWRFAREWRLGVAARQGWTSAEAGGLVAGGSNLVSRAWSIDVERRGVLAGGDALALRLSQPLRVESGALNLMLPVSYSYDTLLADFGVRSLVLAPQGREVMAELAWRGPMLSGDAAMSLFYRRDPGHYAALPDDKGVAVRWSRKL